MEETAWIAFGALVFAATQAWIAYRKLRFDLFAKRFETWEALNDAINARRAKASDIDPSRPFDGGKERQEIWRLQRPMRALFPVDVSDCMKRIDAAMSAHDVALMRCRALPRISAITSPQEHEAKYTTWIDAEREWREAQDELGRLVHRYVRQYGWIEMASVHLRRGTKRMWRATQDRFKRPAE